IIESDRFRIYHTASAWNEAGPGNRQPERIVADFFHQSDILFVGMVEIRGRFRADAVKKAVRLLIKPVIPNVLSFSSFICRAFDLCCGCGASPPETFREFILYSHSKTSNCLYLLR